MPTLLNPSGGIGVVLGGVIATKEGRLELGISGDLGMAVRLRIGDFFFLLRCRIGDSGDRGVAEKTTIDGGDEEVSRSRLAG